MVHYKYYYFNASGINGELPRLIFNLAGVEFEDVRIETEDWSKIKPEMPTGTIPVLEVDGVKYSQMAAISRYLGKTFELMGSTPTDELLINELQEVVMEMILREIVKMRYIQDPVEQKEVAKKFVEESFPKYLNFIEMRLKQNNDGNGFYVGEKATIADVIIINYLPRVGDYMKTLGVESNLSSRKLLMSHIQRVEALPNIAKYLKERPA